MTKIFLTGLPPFETHHNVEMEREEVWVGDGMAARVEDDFEEEDENSRGGFELFPDNSVHEAGKAEPDEIHTEAFPFTPNNKPLKIPMTQNDFPPQRSDFENPWDPFKSMAEWEMAEWLMSCGLSNGERDRFFNLDHVSYYKSNLFIQCCKKIVEWSRRKVEK